MKSLNILVVFEKGPYSKDTCVYRAERIYPVYGCVIVGRILVKGKKRYVKYYPNFTLSPLTESYNWLLLKTVKLFEAGKYNGYSTVRRYREYTL